MAPRERFQTGLGLRRKLHRLSSKLSSSSSKPSTTYQYSPLNDEEREIRLLTILPSESFTADVRILLDTRRFTEHDCPSFEALSYAWGSEELVGEVYVGAKGNVKLAVTQNLEVALPYLRYKDKPRVLWIDAICVNQNDLEERSRQVERMGELYSQADRVVVWLGHEANQSGKAIDLLHHIAAGIDVNWATYTMERVRRPRGDREATPEGSISSLVSDLPRDQESWEPLFHLFARPWFERLWVWQEVRLSNDRTVMMCGFDEMTWDVFNKGVFYIHSGSLDTALFGPKQEKMDDRIQLLAELCDDSFAPFRDHIRHTQSHKCSDPRDRVYALIGVSDHRDKFVTLKPNYKDTYGKVYQDVVLKVLEDHYNLDIMINCNLMDHPTEIPTWVPDWSQCNLPPIVINYRAAAASQSRAEYLGDGILRATGSHAATVKSVESFPYDRSRPAIGDLIKWIRKVAPKDSINGTYVSGGSMAEALTRVLNGGFFYDSWVPNHDYYPDFPRAVSDLKSWLRNPDSEHFNSYEAGSSTFLKMVSAFAQQRTFFTTEEGHIGLGAKNVKPGDKVVVLLGCCCPLILRQSTEQEGKFQVVGDCYMEGIMHGEVLIGPLPAHWQGVLKYDSYSNSYARAFVDIRDKSTQWEDPRLEHMVNYDTDSESETSDYRNRSVSRGSRTSYGGSERSRNVDSERDGDNGNGKGRAADPIEQDAFVDTTLKAGERNFSEKEDASTSKENTEPKMKGINPISETSDLGNPSITLPNGEAKPTEETTTHTTESTSQHSSPGDPDILSQPLNSLHIHDEPIEDKERERLDNDGGNGEKPETEHGSQHDARSSMSRPVPKGPKPKWQVYLGKYRYWTPEAFEHLGAELREYELI